MSGENGFLTNVDKEFLRGEKEYESNQGRYDRRQAIAERTRQAFHDFGLLLNTLDAHERDRIFKLSEAWNHDQTVRFLRTIPRVFAFLWLSLEGEVNSDRTAHTDPRVSFDEFLETGIKRGEVARYDRDVKKQYIDVTFDVDRKEGAFEAVMIDKIARGNINELTDTEMFAVLWHYTEGSESLGDLEEKIQQRRRELADVDESDE